MTELPPDWQPASDEDQPCGRELVGLVVDVINGETVQRAEVLARCELQLGHVTPHLGCLLDSGDPVAWATEP